MIEFVHLCSCGHIEATDELTDVGGVDGKTAFAICGHCFENTPLAHPDDLGMEHVSKKQRARMLGLLKRKGIEWHFKNFIVQHATVKLSDARTGPVNTLLDKLYRHVKWGCTGSRLTEKEMQDLLPMIGQDPSLDEMIEKVFRGG